MTKTFLPFHFFEGCRDQDFPSQKRIYCISDDLLNMCSEPFVIVLNVRAA